MVTPTKRTTPRKRPEAPVAEPVLPPQPQQVTLGEATGLGRHFAPASVSWNVAPVPGTVPKLIVLRVETVAGIFGFAMGEEDFRKFISSCQTAVSGLILA